jgi:hypothetical protein
MWTRTSSVDLDALSADVLLEAQNGSGTWSLATHQRMLEVVRTIDGVSFLTKVVGRLCDPEATMGERFKLSQICTISQKQQQPAIEHFFREHNEQLTTLMELCKTDPLGMHVCKLLASVLAEKRAQVSSAASPSGRRRIAAAGSMPTLPRFEPPMKSQVEVAIDT